MLATTDRKLTVHAESCSRVDVTLPTFDAQGDLCRLTVTLFMDGRASDEMFSGLVIRRPAVIASAPQLRFAKNYFTLNGRPTFLFGSDAWQSYFAADENPWTWAEKLRAARDIGLNLYEDLNYLRPGYQMNDADWRSFLAMGQLAQKHGLVFMPGMLILQNTAVGDDTLNRQSNVCHEYAERFRDFPSLLYYVDGDYRFDWASCSQAKTLWNDWLKRRYETNDQLRKAWGTAAAAKLGEVEFPRHIPTAGMTYRHWMCIGSTHGPCNVGTRLTWTRFGNMTGNTRSHRSMPTDPIAPLICH